MAKCPVAGHEPAVWNVLKLNRPALGNFYRISTKRNQMFFLLVCRNILFKNSVKVYSNIEKSRLPESNFLESRDVSAFLNKHLMLLRSLEERVSGKSVKISDYWTFFHFRALLDSLIRRVEFLNVDN